MQCWFNTPLISCEFILRKVLLPFILNWACQCGAQLDCFLFAILTFAISDQIVQVTVYNELVIPTKEWWNSTNKEIEGGIHQAKTM